MDAEHEGLALLTTEKDHARMAGDSLLDALRDAGLVGAKRVCETSDCGACAVLLDGEPINSCLMFAVQADGRRLLTIEGVARGATPDPPPEAFLDTGGAQWGD